MIRKRLIVRGRVQGVFFRDTMRRLAQSHGAAGWVRNNRDGSVEAVLEGDDDAVDRVVRWAQDAPRGPQVEGVEVLDEAPEGLAGFRIA